MALSQEHLDAIRARHAATIQGPWRWFGGGGRIRKQVTLYLATTHSGRRYVMDFVRSGMSGAQPRFQPKGKGMVEARNLLVYEKDYRDDITDIDNPDARFIAASWQDVADLLAEVDRLRSLENSRHTGEG